MKFNFKKIATVLGSAVLIGSTLGVAAAANYPAPFSQEASAIVVGANAAPSDSALGAANIASSISSAVSVNAATGSKTVTTGGVSDDEITLGGSITGGKIPATLTDTKVPTLLDDKFSWDDGSGSDDYNFHEEIALSNMNVKTSLNDNDFKGVALTNDQGIEYKFVFEDALNTTRVGSSDADTLYLPILGKQYEVEAMTATSITVVTSQEISLAIGQNYTVGGKTVTLNDVFDGSVQVNGQMIDVGHSKKIDGLRVSVTSAGYHANSPETSKAVLKVGTDISKTYSSGDEFIGEDKDNPTWTWEISNLGSANGFVGVKYDLKQARAKDDVVYAGGNYAVPNNYAQVELLGTTSVKYDDFKVSFDDSTDLWNGTSTSSTATIQDANVVIIQGPNKDSMTTSTGSHETNKLYLYWNKTASTNGSVQVYYSDVNSDVSNVVRPRYAEQFDSNKATGNITSQKIATVSVGDTDVNVDVTVAGGYTTLSFVDPDSNTIVASIGGEQLTNTTGKLQWLGLGNTESDQKENAETTDVIVQGENIGTKDNDVMGYYGLIVKTPNSNANSDVVEFSVPDAQVYAKVAVLGTGGSASTPGTPGVGAVTVFDNEVSTVQDKNLIVVGGSCINTVAAKLLGSDTPVCGADFTTKTGVGAGQYLIQVFASPYTTGKVAMLVAGYDAPDTTKAVTFLTTNNAVNTAVGTKMKGTSTTDATVVTA